jgi:hypothetical protein
MASLAEVTLAKANRIPLNSLPQVQLQWYIDYQKLQQNGLIVDAGKYNRGNGKALQEVFAEIQTNEKLSDDLCPNTYLGEALTSLIYEYPIVLLCRDTADGKIYGFAFMTVLFNDLTRSKKNPDIPKLLNINFFCGHGKVSGVGKKMMNSIKEFCKTNEIPVIDLTPLGDTAEAFYSTQGFQKKMDGDMRFSFVPLKRPEGRKGIPVTSLPNIRLETATEIAGKDFDVDVTQYGSSDFDALKTEILQKSLKNCICSYDSKRQTKNIPAIFSASENKILFVCRNTANDEILGSLLLSMFNASNGHYAIIRFLCAHAMYTGAEDMLVREVKRFLLDHADVFTEVFVDTLDFYNFYTDSKYEMDKEVTLDFWKSHGYSKYFSSFKLKVDDLVRLATAGDDGSAATMPPPAASPETFNTSSDVSRGGRATRRKQTGRLRRRTLPPSVRRRRTVRRLTQRRRRQTR